MNEKTHCSASGLEKEVGACLVGAILRMSRYSNLKYTPHTSANKDLNIIRWFRTKEPRGRNILTSTTAGRDWVVTAQKKGF